ncbi:DUF3244 domain-containing protein [Bacteroides sp. 519]|uniref:DUF3244 domain-containing protein n=1 Tax=Bacteroides sp. 519 TaxID=2302937 RepID=UPI0013D083F0|nr:DUF3244 domain-containing protein [Bacteroides sp. 519]NDV57997.1 DUF3244 domain-containing protein [Bacteroides sp. 519]
MRTKLLLLILSCTVLNVFANSLNETAKEIDIKTTDVKRVRSLLVIPVRAFIDKTTILLEFVYLCESATVTIMNEDTGCMVYSNTIMNLNDFTIELFGEDSGNYRLELTVDGKRYDGEFWLE